MGFLTDPVNGDVSSYDAIRVYLWAGMLASDAPQRAALLRAFTPLADYVAAKGFPPERVDTQTGQPGYYTQVLTLFGLGYLDGQFRFARDGALVPAWETGCPAR
jgi:endoglucanase